MLPPGRVFDRQPPRQAWWLRKLPIPLFKWVKNQEHLSEHNNDCRQEMTYAYQTGIFKTASHKNKTRMSRTWYEMFLPINALAYTGDGGLGTRENMKTTSSKKKLCSKVNMPSHSLSVPRKCWANCREHFQYASKTNSIQGGMIINHAPYLNYHYTTNPCVAMFVYFVRRFVVRFHGDQIKISAYVR